MNSTVKTLSIAVILFLCVTSLFFAQEAIKIPKTEEHDVIIKLVLVDIIATDSKGTIITDLKKDDFEVFEDNKRVPIQFLDLIQMSSAETDSMPSSSGTSQPRGQFFVIFDSINSIRRVLDINRTKILDKLIGLVRSGHEVMIFELKEDEEMGILQSLTTDESKIADAVRKASGSIWVEKATDALSVPNIYAGNAIKRRPHTMGHRSVEEQFKEANRNMFQMMMRQRFEKTILGMLSAMNVIKNYHGRKPVLYISSGFPSISFEKMYSGEVGEDIGIVQSEIAAANINDPFKILGKSGKRQGTDIISDLIRFANSHNISFYTMDPDNYLRFSLPDIAYDNFPRKVGNAFDFKPFADEMDILKRIETTNLNILAADTGGATLQGGERFDNFEKKVNRDLSSYYELSYVPPREEPDGEYHRINVKVSRPGVQIRFRQGYTDYLDEQRDQLLFASAAQHPGLFRDISFQLAAMPFQTAKNTFRLWICLGLPVRDLILRDAPDQEYALIKTNFWMGNKTNKKTVQARLNIPVFLSPEYRRRLEQADFFGTGFASDEVELEAGVYSIVFSVIDSDTGKAGSVSRELSIIDRNKEAGGILSLLFGRVTPEDKDGHFELSPTSGHLEMPGHRFIPTAEGVLDRNENLSLFLQIASPSSRPEIHPSFSLVQNNFIVGEIPTEETGKKWDRKAGVWNMVYRLHFNRFPGGTYQLLVKVPNASSSSIWSRRVDLRLR